MKGRIKAQRSIPGLTGVLVDVSRVAGAAAALLLAQTWGGRRLHVPLAKSLRPDHPLARALGWRAALAVAAAMGGQQHDVPTAKLALTYWQIRLLHDAGWSGSATAAALHVDRSTVRRATAGMAPPAGPPQPVTIACLCCGRPQRLVPPAPPAPAAEAESDDAYAAKLPPLLRHAVAVGATTVAALREQDRRFSRGARPA